MATLQPTYTQSCKYCHIDFVPKKRGTQIFCSPSCCTTYCKKKRAGTLGKVTRLPGPGKGGKKGSFAEMALVSATGSLAANTVSQTVEYFSVTRGLVKQVEQLTQLVQKLVVDQAENSKKIGRGTLSMLTKLGATKAEAWEVINTPFQLPVVIKEHHGLPASQHEEISLNAPVLLDIFPPINLLGNEANTK